MANKKYEFKCKSGDIDEQFSVICLEGEEALGRPHRFELTLMSESINIETKNFINRPGCLVLHADTTTPPKATGFYRMQGRQTRYMGVIVEMEKLHSFGEKVFYRVVFASEIWKLSLFKSSCFYKTENKNIIDLIDFIFNLSYESGEKYLAQTDLEIGQLNQNIKNYQPRDYFLQYNESRLNFLQRWMEKEGLYYTITGYEDFKEKLTLYSDVSQLLRQGRKCVTVTYRPIATANTSDVDDSIYKFAQNSKILPKYIKLRDYNYSQASVELTVTQKVSDSGFGELDIFGENYRDVVEGERYAKNYAEALQCDAFSYHGSGSATGIAAGYFIDLLGSEYLVTRVKHMGSQAAAILGADVCETLGFKVKDGYQCDFEALAINSSDSNSEQQQFRLQRITPKPVVAGNLSAMIQISKGQQSGYVNIESNGEYYVSFKSIDIVDIVERSDDENKLGGSNTDGIKMRLSTPYAGLDYGIHFPLPEGTEVLVGFTNGDPDLPVILGAVNNSLAPSLSKTSNQTDNIIKTPSGNRITLSDAEGDRGITLAVPNSKDNSYYDAVQRISPGDDPKASSWKQVLLGDKYENLLGNSYSVSAGCSGSVSASLNSSVSLSSSLSLSAGASTSINLGSIGVDWTPKLGGLNPHGSISLGDGGNSLKFGQDQSATEVNESYEIKVGPLDDNLNKIKFEEKSTLLKAAMAASLAIDTIASYLLARKPEEYRINEINKIERDYKQKVDDAKDCPNKESKIEEAAKTRQDALDKLEKDFWVDNGWGKRLAFAGIHCGSHLLNNAAILASLKSYSEEFAKYKKNIKHRGLFSMDEKQASIVQNFSSKKNETKINEFLMNPEEIKIFHNNNFNNTNNADIQEIHLSSKNKALTIANGKYSIKLLENGIFIGCLDGTGKATKSISVCNGELYFDGSTINLNGGAFSSNQKEVKIAGGTITVT